MANNSDAHASPSEPSRFSGQENSKIPPGRRWKIGVQTSATMHMRGAGKPEEHKKILEFLKAGPRNNFKRSQCNWLGIKCNTKISEPRGPELKMPAQLDHIFVLRHARLTL